MSPDVERRRCAACAQLVAVVPSRHLRAHACPHGLCCVPSYEARRRGEKGRQCAICRQGRQLSLF